MSTKIFAGIWEITSKQVVFINVLENVDKPKNVLNN